MKELAVAITGASGAQYALRLLDELIALKITVHLVVSPAGQRVVDTEIGEGALERYRSTNGVRFYGHKDIGATLASGSSAPEAMVIVPASMGTVGRVRAGVAANLIERAADVMLKEGKPLLLVPRETPFNRIHLENLLALHDAGAIILPANPGFYHKPRTVEDLVDFLVGKILDRLGIQNSVSRRWKGQNSEEE